MTDAPHDAPTLDGLLRSHTPQAIRHRLGTPPRPSYLRDSVYGAIDGAVTTFAVASGAAGADLSSQIVLILGIANLVGDGFSMAAGNYLGSRAEEQVRERASLTEARHIAEVPDGEREEIRQIFAAMGFQDEQLERVVEVITSDRQRWIETMLKEEYGLPVTGRVPIHAAVMTFVAFLLVGAVPLVPFLWAWMTGSLADASYRLSTVMTAIAFFCVGAVKSRFVEQRWYWSGLETLLVGGAAAALAYVFGALLKGIV